jgi:O-antigen/teichoic acid export membrane protein
LASLKQLAGQTVWYGLSNIAAKFLNQLLTPIITYMLNNPAGMVDYGNFSMLYAGISFINIIYTYGLETAYFRFSATGEDQGKLFQTSFTSLLVSSFVFSALLIMYRHTLSDFIGLGEHSEYIIWCVLIVAIDALAAIPFARLRQEGRPRKYAFTRVAGIVVNIFFTIYLVAYYPTHRGAPDTAFARWYASNTNVGFLILANLAQSLVTFLLLYREWGVYRFKFDGKLWGKIIAYSAPMLIVGLGGMVNETFDRIMLPKLLPASEEARKIAVAIYGANYKLAIVITLFIQAFKMSAEPFFFNQATDRNAPKTYARVMKWFVITLCLAFLFTALYIDLWKYFIHHSYWAGLGVVPILLAANIALGIYYNLSVWYKITDKMYMGMLITLLGAAITLVLNFAFIPRFGMYACAWATFLAYAVMMVLSYVLGQKYFPVPYARKKLLSYLGVMLLLFFGQRLVVWITDIVAIRLVTATVLMYLFLRLVYNVEKKELGGMPVIGKWIK